MTMKTMMPLTEMMMRICSRSFLPVTKILLGSALREISLRAECRRRQARSQKSTHEKLKRSMIHQGPTGLLGQVMLITAMLKVMMMIMTMMMIMIYRCVLEEVEVETLEKKPILECTHR